MNNIKDIWQEAYDSAREQGMSDIMARDHADDKLADLHETRQDLLRRWTMVVKGIYDLKLHEEFQIEKSYLWVRRVAGGWLYMNYEDDKITSTFVPFHNEFMAEEGCHVH